MRVGAEAMIAAITRVLGVNSIIIYVLGLLLLGAGIWLYGGYKHYEGKVEGMHSEQLKWASRMAELRAENERKRQAAQSQIDLVEAETLSQQKRADEAQALLEEQIHETENAAPGSAPAFPKRLSDAINPVGR